jgi:hypothetical protein
MRFVVLAAVSSLVVACSIAELPADTGTNEPAITSKSEPTSAATGACSSPSKLAPEDAAKLARCTCAKGGSARCVPTEKVPATIASQLESCEGGSCVPDSILTGGIAAVRSCQAKGKEGRCLGLCVPAVAKYESMLGRGDGDVCPEDERCVPCENPLDGTRTGVCEASAQSASSASCGGGAGKAAGGAGGGSAGAAAGADPNAPRGARKDCCAVSGSTRGQCVAKNDAPASLQGSLSQHECDSAEVCAPTEALEGKNPVTCGAGRGVCVSVCVDLGIKEMFAFDLACGLDQRCVPCFMDPFEMIPTNAPGCPR